MANLMSTNINNTSNTINNNNNHTSNSNQSFSNNRLKLHSPKKSQQNLLTTNTSKSNTNLMNLGSTQNL